MNNEYSPYYDFSSYQHHYMPDMTMYDNRNQAQPELVNSEEGFARGNMFRELYSPWDNYKPYIETPKTEKEKDLLEVQMASFALTDLNIYLDMYPNDKDCLDYFNQYRKRVDDLTRNYEHKYGPLNLHSSSLEKYPFTWINNWPWEDDYNVEI